MANLIVDPRDQKFVLYEMLHVEELFKAGRYADFSGDMVDMVLREAERMAVEELLFPVLAEGYCSAGCRLENGAVYVPEAFHRVYKLYCDGGWITMERLPGSGEGVSPCGHGGGKGMVHP